MSLASAVEPYADQIFPLGVLFEDAFGGPPTIETAVGYNGSLDAFEFMADVDQLTAAMFPDGGLPQVAIIDTSVMEIVYKAVDYDEAEILAVANSL